tara:strand:+ start:2002 stop:3804 length:1803 start_codon:yes stop_codon:yes gene_type:complete
MKYYARYLIFSLTIVIAQNYRGSELRSLEPVLYGKFETRIKPAQGDGLVSSFFTYNDSCCGTSPWNEIDIEILGRYDRVIDMNTITWGQSSHVRQHYVPFNPHEDFHIYGFEWTPEYVAWFIDGVEVYRQTESHIEELSYPQKIMMNIWNPVYDDWVGVWDERILPRFSYYDYVSYSSYTPGEGNMGTDQNFTFQWQDDFDFFDSTRWEKSHNHGWGGNQSLLIEDNIVYENGYMILCLTSIIETGYQDATIPSALYARQHGSTLNVRFSEELNPASAEDISNYSLAETTFNNATLMPDNRTVLLTMDNEVINALNMGVFNIEDDNDPPNILPWEVVWLDFPQPLGDTIKINAGGAGFSEYLNDQVWGHDKEYGHEGGNYQLIDNSIDIGLTDNDEIYRSSLNRLASYKVRLRPAIYNLKMMFSDNHYDHPEDRTFDVVIEDSLWVDNLDVVALVGSKNAYDIFLDDVEVVDGTLDIYFSSEIYGEGYSSAGPFLNGIEIIVQQELSIVDLPPGTFKLSKPYPNPFNHSLTIPINVTDEAIMKLDVIDLQGRQVDVIFNGLLTRGLHNITWDSKTHASGHYIIRLTTEKKVYHEKTTLLK